MQQEYIYEAGLDQFVVVKAAFDIHGSWLATVEERSSKDSNPEFSLKLWGYDEQAQRFAFKVLCLCEQTWARYLKIFPDINVFFPLSVALTFLFPLSFELNTTITAAHNDGITDVCFCPATETTMLVTTAKDGQFKVWLLGSDSDTQSEFQLRHPRLV